MAGNERGGHEPESEEHARRSWIVAVDLDDEGEDGHDQPHTCGRAEYVGESGWWSPFGAPPQA